MALLHCHQAAVNVCLKIVFIWQFFCNLGGWIPSGDVCQLMSVHEQLSRSKVASGGIVCRRKSTKWELPFF